MKLLDLTLATPAENLACDEVLLDWCEQGGGEVLRFWEPAEYFVVAGHGNRLATEVNQAACHRRAIPIYRRCSGGGTVLQGPGCLNYSLVLHIPETGPLAAIRGANQFVMERNRAAVEAAVGEEVQILGHTDLTMGGRKFSGNAQRRHRRALLFHGAFLHRFDLGLMGDLLAFPSMPPAYRQGRRHDEFLMN
ncbi:MAG: lipoate--protein ligase family protein, partial [Verrucomicrobia bacterium]|nr:lipoate--protein ligase family protein [Verrucomicrobiota bacterium]